MRAKAPQGQTALSTFLAHMEQRYQDSGNYGANNQCVVTPANTQNFTMACTLGAEGQSFTATATGKGQLKGITYEIDSSDTRKTNAHPKGLPPTNCWTTKGGVCD
ncbi:hypothetical protein LC612_37500 [Nostoc sp. CHAB 5834]|nr:hypothetical protein [Nostoc sp. CHAB 5834]